MAKSSVIERALKLLALERRGATEGEREAARSALDAHCERTGTTLEQLVEGERTTECRLSCRNDHEKALAELLSAEICKTWEVMAKHRRGRVTVIVTRAEAAEIATAFSVLRRAMRLEAEAAQLAFTSRNVHPPELPDGQKPKVAAVDSDLVKRARAMRTFAPAPIVARHRQVEYA